jgi:hypothetical protein
MRAIQPLCWAFALCLLASASALAAQAPVPGTPTPAVIAKPDSVSVDTAQGYARILFTFGQATPVTASIAD